jgi:DNA-binding CsgD family transcriptional regulator
LAAAKAKRDAGALDSALRLLSVVETEPPTALRSALVEQLRGRIAFDQRHGTEAAELLVSAAQRLESAAPRLARDAHLEALAAAVWAGERDGAALISKAAEAACAAPPAELPPRSADLLLDALARLVTDGYVAAGSSLTTALAAVRDDDIGTDEGDSSIRPVRNRVAGILATEAWDYETGRTVAERQVRAARDSGAWLQLQFASSFLAYYVWLAGDTRTAAMLVEDDRTLSAITGRAAVSCAALLLEAFCGEAPDTASTLETLINTAGEDDQIRTVVVARYVGAVLNNGLGRHSEALVSARRVMDAGVFGYQTLAAPELAEAASREGDASLLAEISAWVEARAAATPTDWALGISARVKALANHADAHADSLYRESIEHLGRTPVRVELARSQLLYGEWLRRRGRRSEARDQITLAYEALADMRIGAFAERALRELSATTKRRTRRRVDDPSTKLTSQELLIAELVQQGLSNPEIGGRLFLSPRTIEWHLRNVFDKVDVSSRRQLRDKQLDPYRPTGLKTGPSGL